jgi:hypothetical protein
MKLAKQIVFFVILVFFVIFLGTPFPMPECLAEDYYVDFDNGSDTNTGMSTASPWRTLPGNTGRTSWGNSSTLPYSHPIDSSYKIPKSSTIYIKAGTTYSSADPNAGNILIKTDYYSSPTQESERITIAVSSDWGSGHVTIDGTGLVYGGDFNVYLLGVRYLSYITIKGNDESRRFKIVNTETASKRGLIIKGTGATTRSTANKVDYLTIQDCGYGFMVSYTDNFLFDHVLLKDNDNSGISIGAWGDEICNGGILQSSESVNNGTSGSDAGIQVVGSTNIKIINVVSHDCRARNFDYGTTTNTTPCTVMTINCTSYNGTNGGFCCNGGPALVDSCIYYYINCISWNDNPSNQSRGSFHSYDGCTVYYYHCIADKRGVTGHTRAFSAQAESGEGSVKLYVKNCVGYFPTSGGGKEHWIFDLREGSSSDRIYLQDISYNAYDIRQVTIFAFLRKYGDGDYSYNFAQWVAQNKCGSYPDTTGSFAKNDSSIEDYWTDVGNHNYTLTSDSGPLSNAGVYLSSPAAVLTDRCGNSRSNRSEIGPYEFSESSICEPTRVNGPTPPKGLRIVN